MFEDDAILPDDFEETPPQAEETPEQDLVPDEVETPAEDTKPAEEPTEPTEPVQETPKVKIKYNHEEKELSIDEAAALAQKGLNYEKAVERAKQEARDAWIAEQGYTWNGKPITTEAEYKQAIAEKELIEKYKGQNIPEEVIRELVENRKFREQFQSEQQTKAEQDKKDADAVDFLNYFKQANGRDFDAGKDTIPPEVWEATEKGVPLRYAYAEHMNNQLRSQLQVLKKNEENTKKAPVGSVTSHGSTEIAGEDDFLVGFNSID